MSRIADEMQEYLAHYGMPRRSGRYPYGSGENPYQHELDFLGRIEKLKKDGWEETPENIKAEFGLTTTQYRAQKGVAKDARRILNVATAKSLKEDGLGDSEIARKMSERLGTHVNESTVRSWLNAQSESRMMQSRQTADFIRKKIEEKGMIEVGAGVEKELNISKEKLDQALTILQMEGYPVYGGRVPQATNPSQKTTIKVVCPKGTEHREIYDFDRVNSLNEYISRDDGKTFEKKFHYPKSMDSKRLMIRYKEDGGIEQDGLIQLRRNVPDLSLGESRYSQVRILVDGDRYLKGMAAYSDDMPDGVDVIFNTNKPRGTDMRDVLKKIKSDPDNPFGANIKESEKGGQYWYDDPKTGERKLGLINKTREEGDWDDWKNGLPAQFLSKQSYSLAKKQLGLAITDKADELNEIEALTNPTIKKHFLMKFADECDSAAVHLKAAALPGQKYHVILPVPSMKDNEVYAPGYEPGTQLALIRYPHGGTFEIPILKVTNRNQAAKKLIGTDSIDAVCINSKVAEQLSGADFDGDTVMCIPTNDPGGKIKIISTPPLKQLEGFDPKMDYAERKGMKYMKDPATGKDSTQMEMGKISNLITDMTLKGANQDELAQAVRHSMVVIDAAKHKLDYKQSEVDNNISALRKRYQYRIDEDGKEHTGGASTLISRASGQASVVKRQGSPKINQKGTEWYDPTKPEGALVYKDADDAHYTSTKVNKRTGEVQTIERSRTQRSTQMAETTDAHTLVSDKNTKMENLYADYANSMKDMANRARIEAVTTGKIAYSKSAKETYAPEVASLNEKLRIALMNAPRERQAQLRVAAEIGKKTEAAKASGEELSKSDLKKARQQALTRYRSEMNSVSRRERSIKITDREWDAIQAGAVSENILKQILNNADVDELRQRATPRSSTDLSPSKISRIKAYANSNYTIGQIAAKMNLSTSTVSKYLKG